MKSKKIRKNNKIYIDPHMTEEAMLLRKNEIDNTQVMSKLPDGKIRLYKIVDYNDTDYCDNKPFQTIRTITIENYDDIKI